MEPACALVEASCRSDRELGTGAQFHRSALSLINFCRLCHTGHNAVRQSNGCRAAASAREQDPDTVLSQQLQVWFQCVVIGDVRWRARHRGRGQNYSRKACTPVLSSHPSGSSVTPALPPSPHGSLPSAQKSDPACHLYTKQEMMGGQQEHTKVGLMDILHFFFLSHDELHKGMPSSFAQPTGNTQCTVGVVVIKVGSATIHRKGLHITLWVRCVRRQKSGDIVDVCHLFRAPFPRTTTHSRLLCYNKWNVTSLFTLGGERERAR